MSFYYMSDLHLELYKEPVDINQFINISDITSPATPTYPNEVNV